MERSQVFVRVIIGSEMQYLSCGHAGCFNFCTWSREVKMEKLVELPAERRYSKKGELRSCDVR